jgi:hypothetical protein
MIDTSGQNKDFIWHDADWVPRRFLVDLIPNINVVFEKK